MQFVLNNCRQKNDALQKPGIFNPKTWRMIRWTAILVMISYLHVSARTYSQKVTLKVQNEPLAGVLKAIKQQTGYNIILKTELLRKAGPVSADIRSLPLKEALELCFKGQPLTYRIVDKTIVLKQKEQQEGPQSFFTPPPAVHDLRVHITDSLGSPLQGASVVVKGTKQGGQTDAEGNITLAGLTGSETLVVSYVGYETKEISVGDNTILTIVLNATPAALDEVQLVSKGYYNTTKALNTGNVSVVKSDVIEKQPVNDPMLALEGRVPGLEISQTSGIPGAQLKVRLRGQNSIANGNDPLYIVDGIPYTSASLTNTALTTIVQLSPFNNLNPKDIDNITVLKDADATAIYGSRGANGVILITTKKGKAGKTVADFNVYSGTGKVTRMLDLMNTQQYLEMRHRAFERDGISPAPSDYDINGAWDTTRYTDWQKYFIGNTSHYTDASGSLSGGNEQTQFILSGNYHKETTVFPGDFYDRKMSFHTAITHTSVNKRFHADFSAGYVNDYSHLPAADLTTSQVFLAPDAPVLYDADGNLNWQNSTWTNPLAALLKTNNANTDNLLGNLLVSYTILSGLKISTGIGYNMMEMNQHNLVPFTAYNPSKIAQSSQLRSHIYGTNRLNSWIAEPQISYSRQISKGQLDVLLGTTFQENKSNSIAQNATGFSVDDQIENIGAATTIKMNNYNIGQYRYNAFYGRIGYNWDKKYIVNLTARRDGSSRFGPGKQFGNFGALGVSWIFSKEEWLKNALPFISFGKLRASYGSTGNDQLGDYKYLSTYSTYYIPYQGLNGQTPTQLTNPDFGWERVNKLEAGLELGIINDRIHLEASWYRNRTGNQLVGYSLPAITGFGSVQANLPAIVQNSGLELELNTVNIQNNHFNWTSSFNISFPRNKLVSYPNIEASTYAYRYVVGKPLFIHFVYHYTGVDPATGDYQFADLNGDNGQISSPEDWQPIFAGTDFTGGFNNTVTWKGWELDCFFQFVKQTGQQFLFDGAPGYMGNQPVSVLKPGQPLSASYDNYSPFSHFLSSDAFYGDASYIRLKNIALSWQLPEQWRKSIGVQGLQVYMQCQNLLLITGYKGYDPETAGVYSAGAANLPPLRAISIGARLSL